MTRPFDRSCQLPARGTLDTEAGEFWAENVFQMPRDGQNLSAYEQNRVFLNADGRQFVDASFASHANIDADSRSAIIADFNGDVRPDVLVGSVGGGALRLFLNRFPNAGHRIQIRLVGRESNRNGTGSRITLQCGDLRVVRDLFPANGFMGQSPIDTIIGVGDAEAIDQLTIRWPTGKVQSFQNVPAEQLVTIIEDSDSIGLSPLTRAAAATSAE